MKTTKYKRKAKEIKKTKLEIKDLYKDLDKIKKKKEIIGFAFTTLSLFIIISLCPKIININNFVEHYKTFIALITYALGSAVTVTALSKLIDVNISADEKEILEKIEQEKEKLKNHKEEQKISVKTIENEQTQLFDKKEMPKIKVSPLSYDKNKNIKLENSEAIERLKNAKQRLLDAQQDNKTYQKSNNNVKKQHVKYLAKQTKVYPYNVGQR